MSNNTTINLDLSVGFSVPVAQMIGQFLECIFYGIFLVTFCMCARVLVSRHTSAWHVNRYLAAAAIWMLTFASIDIGAGVYHNVLAFNFFPAGPDAEFNDISFWANVMSLADFVAQTMVGDAILLYRFYIIWNRRWYLAALPAAMWAGGSACGLIATYRTATLRISAVENDSYLVPFVDSMMSLTLVFNVVATTLIVWKIWHTKRQTSSIFAHGRVRSPLENVARIVIESGLLYTLTMIILFVLYATDNNAQYIVSSCSVQIVGIVFNLIIIRIDGEFSKSDVITTNNSGRVATTQNTDMQLHSVHRLHASRTPSAGRPVELAISPSRYVDKDFEERSDVEAGRYTIDVDEEGLDPSYEVQYEYGKTKGVGQAM